MLEEASQSCNQWTQLSESVEQRVTGLHDSIEVLRVTALAEKQKGEASKPALVVLERSLADLQAQLAGEKKSHQLTQVHSLSTTKKEFPGCTHLDAGGAGNKLTWLKAFTALRTAALLSIFPLPFFHLFSIFSFLPRFFPCQLYSHI